MAANPSIQLGTDGNWAIKEDNLLAYKKDGTRFFNKEFDFTRGSFATFVDKDGLIKVSGIIDTELVVNGDFATDSDWFKTTGWSISNGQAIASTGAYNTLQQVFPIVLGKTYEVKFDVTSITSGSVSMTLGADSGLQRNQIGSYTEIIEYNNFFASSGPRSGSGGFVGSIDNVSVKEIQTDVPRIDFTDDATGHLLLEPQSTNLVVNSENLSVLNQTTINPVISPDVSPSGKLNSWRATRTGSNNRIGSSFSAVSGLTYTTSIYAKKVSGSGVINITDYQGNPSAYNLTENWQRYTLTASATSTTGRAYVTLQNIGDVVDLYGLQSEQQSFATSYIPTFSGQYTRLADTCTGSTDATIFNDSEGVLYAEIKALANDGTFRVISLSDGTTSNRIWLYYTTVSNLIQVFDGTTIIAHTIDVTNFIKVAVVYDSNGTRMWVNGSEQGSNSFVGFSGFDRINFSNSNSSNYYFYGNVKDLRYYDTALTDAELTELTT